MEFILEQLRQSWNNLLSKLQGWLDTIVTNLPNFILAVLVISLGFYLARHVRKYFQRMAQKMTSNRTVSSVMSKIGVALFVAIFVFIAIGVLNLDTVLASLLAGAGVMGLAVGLALQEPLINVFSGILLSVRKLYNIGDLVETNGYFGTIKNITLRTTLIRTNDGKEVTIPNKLVIQNPMTNYTNTNERRVAVECGVSYGDDLEKVREIALTAIREGCDYEEERGIDFYYTSFGNSSINFMIRFWLHDPLQPTYLSGQSQAIVALKKAFDENDITIPFPIRTLDFGIKGGERLNEMLDFQQLKKGSNGSKKDN